MAKWIPCGNTFITGDVLRWTEHVWKPRSRHGRGRVIGERVIVAQVLKELEDGKVLLAVKQCDTKRGEFCLKPLPELKPGTETKRRRAPLVKGGVERYQWGGADGKP